MEGDIHVHYDKKEKSYYVHIDGQDKYQSSYRYFLAFYNFTTDKYNVIYSPYPEMSYGEYTSLHVFDHAIQLHKNGSVPHLDEFLQTEENRLLYENFMAEADDLAELIERHEVERQKRILKEKHKQQRLKKIAQMELEEEGVLFEKTHRRPPIPQDIADFVYRRDGGKCVLCGSTENLQFDHIIPFSKGGATTAENLQILCQKCNLRKSNNIG